MTIFALICLAYDVTGTCVVDYSFIATTARWSAAPCINIMPPQLRPRILFCEKTPLGEML